MREPSSTPTSLPRVTFCVARDPLTPPAAHRRDESSPPSPRPRRAPWPGSDHRVGLRAPWPLQTLSHLRNVTLTPSVLVRSTPRTPDASTSPTESPTPQTQTLLQTPTDVTIAVRRAHLDPLLRARDLQLNALRLKPLTCPMPPPQGWPHSRCSCFVRAVDALYAYLTCGNYDFNYGNNGPRAPLAPSALGPYPCPDRAQTAARICVPSATSAPP